MWAEGPECDPACPGEWSDWHNGYIAGLERGFASADDDKLDSSHREWLHTHPVVQTLTAVRLALKPSMSERGITQWFESGNKRLDGRTPWEAIRDSDYTVVVEAAESFADGDYL